MLNLWLVVSSILYICATAELTSLEKPKLYFSFITALTNYNGDRSTAGGIPMIDYAIEEINNSSTILPNYTLHYTKILDSKCSSTSVLNSFLYHFNNESKEEPVYLSTVCCGCSSATVPVAQISHHWNIPHISFASSSSELNDRNRFKSLFRTLPRSVDAISHTVLSLMEKFDWKRLAILAQDSNAFEEISTSIDSKFDQKENWNLKMLKFNPDDVNYGETFKEIGKDYRIILINALEVHAYHFFCEVYKTFGNSIRTHEVVIILHTLSSSLEWWENEHESSSGSSCSREEIMMVLNYTLLVTPDIYNVMASGMDQQSNTTTISGLMNSKQFQEIYSKRLAMPQYRNYSKLDSVGSSYDAIWMLAVGLDMVDKWVSGMADDTEAGRVPSGMVNHCNSSHLSGKFVSLKQFDYRNKKMGCLLNLALSFVNFTGITGNVVFQNGIRKELNVMEVRQFRINKNSTITCPTIGKVVPSEEGDNRLYLMDHETQNTIWPGLRRDLVSPYDGTPSDIVEALPLTASIFLVFIGVVGMVLAAGVFVFNIAFRNKRIVKISSPNLNYITIFGSVLMFMSIFCTVAVNSITDCQGTALKTALCTIQIWLFFIGYSMCLSIMLVKPWRIQSIFNHPKPNKVIKDRVLVLIVAVLVAIDVLILTVGTGVPYTRMTAQLYANNGNTPKAMGEAGSNQYTLICKQRLTDIWILASFAYKELLQFAAVYMAFATKNVKVRAINESKQTMFTAYFNNLIIISMIVIEFVLNKPAHDGNRNIYVPVFGTLVFLAATSFLLAMFIPRVLMLMSDPKGKNIFQTSNERGAAISPTLIQAGEHERSVKINMPNCTLCIDHYRSRNSNSTPENEAGSLNQPQSAESSLQNQQQQEQLESQE